MPSPLQGLDQVVAVTQDHVNASLDTRFRLDGNLSHLDVKNNWGKINAEMDPPTVDFYIPSEIHKVHFCVNLSSGTCTWYKIDDTTDPPSIKPITADIKAWTLAFTVNLSLDKINEIPDEIKNKIKFPGSYSLSQLLLDFNTADLSSFDPELSHTPGVSGTDPDRQVAFTHFMEAYLEKLKGGDTGILGYAITVPDPKVTNPYAPTFSPMSVTFQTMENRDSDTNAAQPGLNCFLFCEMTSNLTPPDYINWTENWVDQGKSGTMVISKKNFWDNFFVIHSTFLNRMALDMLNRLAYALDNSGDLNKWDVSWQFSTQRPSDGELAWKSTKEQSMSYYWSHSEPKHTVDIYDKYARNCDTKVDVALDTGANVITVTASSHVWREYIHIYPAGREWIKDTYEIDATISWSYSFILNSVTDGTLEMSAKLVSPICTVTKSETSSIGNFWRPSDEELSTWAQEDLLKRVDDENTLLTDVAEGLKTQSQFVFPGGGTFFMKDPKYNSYGDLTVTLQYKQELCVPVGHRWLSALVGVRARNIFIVILFFFLLFQCALFSYLFVKL